MPAYVNVGDFVKIAVMGYVFIWLANKALDKAGMSAFRA